MIIDPWLILWVLILFVITAWYATKAFYPDLHGHPHKDRWEWTPKQWKDHLREFHPKIYKEHYGDDAKK